MVHIFSMKDSDLIDLALKLSAVKSSENISLVLKKSLSRIFGEGKSGVYELSWERGVTSGHSPFDYEVMAHELHCEEDLNFNINEKSLFRDCLLSKEAVREGSSLIFPIFYKKEMLQMVRLDVPKASVKDHLRIQKLVELYNNLFIVLNEKDRDYLTNLYNRESFNRIANLICNNKYGFSKDPRKSQTFLAILDIDHFKSVNDKHGHLIGDEVLIRFAQVMRDSVRREDFCFRYGGEEFVLIFQTGKSSDAFPVLDRFRSSIESTSFPRVDRITVSTGFVQIREKTDPFILSDMADRALYFAKEHGRNQVQSYEELLEKGLINSPDMPDSDVFLFD